MAMAILTNEQLSESIQADIQALKKRGGRKPGSKNKPKAQPVTAGSIIDSAMKLIDTSLPSVGLTAAVNDAIKSLQSAAAVQVSAMDSESRLAEKIKELQRAMLAAVELLRAAL